MAKRNPINVEYQTLVVIWLALLSSQAIFFAVVWFIGLALLGGKEFVLGVLQLVTRKQWSPKAIPWSATLILPFLFADVRRPRSLDTRYSASPNSFGMPILAKTLALSIPLHLSLQQTYWAPYLLPRS